jgi:hypothetical protein
VFYEVCESFVHAVVRAMQGMPGGCVCDGKLGLLVNAERRSTRNAWEMKESRPAPLACSPVSRVELLGKIAGLYRLPKPLLEEDGYTWFERVRVAQRDLLQACLLPFGRPHKMGVMRESSDTYSAS